MGSVLRALRKSAPKDGPTIEPVIHIVSLAVANAEKAIQERLNAPPAKAQPAEAEPSLMEPDEIDELGSSSREPAEASLARQAAPSAPAAEGAVAVEPARTLRYSPLLMVRHRPQGPAAEQIRQLRTTLLSLVHGGSLRCVITSARKGEGKTVAAANLAWSLSEISRKRTLVIDADLRRGRLAELFGLENAPGLSDLLSGRCEPAQAVQNAGKANLDIVACGLSDGTPVGELLSGDGVEKALQSLMRQYDHVIIDTPPADLADASILGRLADLALLVVRLRKTPRKAVDQAVQTLQNAGVNLAGLVALDGRTS